MLLPSDVQTSGILLAQQYNRTSLLTLITLLLTNILLAVDSDGVIWKGHLQNTIHTSKDSHYVCQISGKVCWRLIIYATNYYSMPYPFCTAVFTYIRNNFIIACDAMERTSIINGKLYSYLSMTTELQLHPHNFETTVVVYICLIYSLQHKSWCSACGIFNTIMWTLLKRYEKACKTELKIVYYCLVPLNVYFRKYSLRCWLKIGPILWAATLFNPVWTKSMHPPPVFKSLVYQLSVIVRLYYEDLHHSAQNSRQTIM